MPKVKKIKSLLDQLTFGFELEGYFNRVLEDLPGTFQEDGSVHNDNPFNDPVLVEESMCQECEGRGSWVEDCDCNCQLDHDHFRENCVLACDNSDYHEHNCEVCDGNGHIDEDNLEATEYASPVYSSPAKLTEALAVFTEEAYAWGDGCGFHLHVGLKNRRQPELLLNAATDWQFLHDLQNQARYFCPCQDSRLAGDRHYFRNIDSRNQLWRGAITGEKYRFLRVHPRYKTLEFRFLCPCQHKAENATKVINALVGFLNEPKTTKACTQVETLVAPKHKERELSFDPKPDSRSLGYSRDSIALRLFGVPYAQLVRTSQKREVDLRTTREVRGRFLDTMERSFYVEPTDMSFDYHAAGVSIIDDGEAN